MSANNIFVAYAGSAPANIDVCAYRSHLEVMKPELRLIRDLCNYGKHGPVLWKALVSKTERRQTMVADYTGLLLGITNHHSEEKIVVALKDHTERHFDYLAQEVVKFWTDRFAEKDF